MRLQADKWHECIVTENHALRKQDLDVGADGEFWPKFSRWFDFHGDERFRRSDDGRGLRWDIGNNPHPLVVGREDQSHL